MSRIDETRPFIPVGIAVLTVSDTRSLEEDKSGKVLAENLITCPCFEKCTRRHRTVWTITRMTCRLERTDDDHFVPGRWQDGHFSQTFMEQKLLSSFPESMTIRVRIVKYSSFP